MNVGSTCLMRASAAMAACLLFHGSAWAQEGAQDLAKQLSNPIASLISVPFQYDYDDAGVRYWAESPEFGPDGFGARARSLSYFRSRGR